ncbi:GGDEF/EAL domain-containing response regulator [sulfur-oxidizing endosymbiont of Gigantopelta aegis]|uniref:GGDEF/EAL domain-containing response regulator n=1 Tax=sulfur-oxidizing endosymbiont of Gigantopelta aegis TaxID=2794934 RepID=UPI0018DC2882|nr:EAL domain-containing protein [sulfur-oxidizing endosymbiont of Gigantopelta aegis]
MLIENKNILLIDDEKYFRDSIRFFLEDCDFNIKEAENGRIGTEMILQHQPDLILMDLYMPEMTGLEVLSWVKAHKIEIPIIIISGAGVISDVAEALRQGAWDYIFKPIEDLSVLEYAVNKALERVELLNKTRHYQTHLEEEVEKRTLALKQVNATLLDNQKHIKRANLEEQVVSQLLKLSLQSKDENEFLLASIKAMVEQFSCNQQSIEGALFTQSNKEKTMELAYGCHLSEAHQQQCKNPAFAQELFHQYHASKQKSLLENHKTEHHFCVAPAYLKGAVFALIIIYYPPNCQVEENEKSFMSRISDILSMGLAKFDAEKEIQYLAYHDSLTGLPNRSMLLRRLEQDITITVRHGWHGALIFVDLDRFKNLNDALGHIIGDELLIQVGKRLQNLMRSEDMIARIGGDEFVILLLEQQESVDVAAQNAQMIAKKISDVISRPYVLKLHDYFMTASLGISFFPEDGDSATDLLKHADTAMYRAKTQGGNDCQFYLPDMQKAVDERLRIEKDVRQALIKNEMMLYYQPQVMMADNKIIGAEALLRWQHPERGWVSPADFIPIAEETGLILDIGEWVLETSIEQIKQWYDQKLLNDNDQFAVNVSPLQFRHKNFVTLVKGIIKKVKLPPSLLKIELTEGTVIENIDDIIKKMQQLKIMGINFSLDDFGTGYSSLSYLTKLPIDQLKIDRSFVKDISTDSNDEAIVEMIISMGNHLELDVIAEGVESKEELELLQAKGCLSYQGYYYSPAVNAQTFKEMLNNRQQEHD